MPIKDYVCGCGHVEKDVMSSQFHDNPICPVCKEKMVLNMSTFGSFGFTIKGYNYKNGYSGGKKR